MNFASKWKEKCENTQMLDIGRHADLMLGRLKDQAYPEQQDVERSENEIAISVRQQSA